MTQAARPDSATEAVRPDECTCHALRKATRRVTQLYDHILVESGLRVTQFGLLATLRVAQPLSMTALAHRMAMDRTTLTRNLKPLERAGLVALAPGGDRRTRMVLLTDPGRDALRRAAPFWRQAQLAMAEALGPDRLKQLHALLDASMEPADRMLGDIGDG
ncbi:MAG: winged helix-turn-helix transcriptional regulator [Rhodospirillaceae bacterium]|nr:winged helix-turn-helix transcriptional regulator [Rhodospirillaceae bacterium]